MPWAWIAAGAVVAAALHGVKAAGEGVDAAGSGALKIGLVAAGGYFLAKKAGVLK